eukprot:308344_1
MAEQKKRIVTCSLLSLICPGSGKGFGRKMAIKTNNKKNDSQFNAYIKDSVNLNGCDTDNATITKHWNKKSYYCDIVDIICYKSNQSCCDAQLTVQSAINRIRSWAKEDRDTFAFYFSGHGSKSNGGGICFKDGVLLYKDLIKLIPKSKREWTTITIDACYSGFIVSALENCNLDKEIVARYSSQSDEVSADLGTKGGYFTRTFLWVPDDCERSDEMNFDFDCRGVHWRNGPHTHLFDVANHDYSDGTTSTQQPGQWTNWKRSW